MTPDPSRGIVRTMLDMTDSERILGAELRVGRLAYGCWRLVAMSVRDATERIATALDAGLTLVDTADVYGLDHGGSGFGDAERLLGEVLAATPSLRDRMVLATKGGIRPPTPYDSSPGHLRAALHGSLSRLGVDHVDLYQVHRPDVFAHPADVAATLTAFRDEGLVREVGISNHTAAQHDALQAHLDFPLASIQPQFSAHHVAPLFDGTLDTAMRHGSAVLVWSPLAGGAIPLGDTDVVRRELLEVLDRIARREGVSRSDVAMAFVLSHPSEPIAIVGSTNPQRIASAPAALRIDLERDDLYAIIEATTGRPLP